MVFALTGEKKFGKHGRDGWGPKADDGGCGGGQVPGGIARPRGGRRLHLPPGTRGPLASLQIQP
jgi:hypothetical protein